MKTGRILLLIFGLLLSLAACNTVTVVPNGGWRRSGNPTYEERKNYFLAGLIGDHRINVREVCGDREAVQLQSQDKLGDVLLRIFTIGIYSPRTARVWCQRGAKS